jgi:hypothetical protein
MGSDDIEKGHLRDTPAVPNAKTTVAHPTGDRDFRVERAGMVQIAVVGSGSLFSRQFAMTLMQKTDTLLSHHNMYLSADGIPDGIDQPSWRVDTPSFDSKDPNAWPALAAKLQALGLPKNKLPVVFIDNAGGKDSGLVGATYPAPPDPDTDYPQAAGSRVVLCFLNKSANDNVTLIHEIGHAAGKGAHDAFDENRKDGRHSIMVTPGDMTPEQAANPQYYRQSIEAGLCLWIRQAPWTIDRAGSNLQVFK